jgi:hypothetical protein
LSALMCGFGYIARDQTRICVGSCGGEPTSKKGLETYLTGGLGRLFLSRTRTFINVDESMADNPTHPYTLEVSKLADGRALTMRSLPVPTPHLPFWW